MMISPRENDSNMNKIESTPVTDNDLQQQLKSSHDKQRQQSQEVYIRLFITSFIMSSSDLDRSITSCFA